MKKLFLILILIGFCFTSSFAQKEKFFSIEANVNTRYFFNSYEDILTTHNYGIALIPYFNINSWKFGIGFSYSNLRLAEHRDGGINRYYLGYIDVPLVVNYNFYKKGIVTFNGFGMFLLNALIDASTYSSYYGRGRYDINIEPNTSPFALSFRLGFEVSLLSYSNIRINVAPFVNYKIFGNSEKFSKENILEPPFYVPNPPTPYFFEKTSPFSLGISLGVEYMFKFKKD
ncbi:MAG: hypothetical protein LBM25_07070 [Bacteroidales bacterium]|jgi:hypothetical protein|nr:hypothetical protein [Bacteroidales bacterium]